MRRPWEQCDGIGLEFWEELLVLVLEVVTTTMTQADR